ncbi:hypothetical protein [Pedobacter sp.]|uniref:hypothetical protein n=1 Tax=Pedobacter sp. TaxID=1411316 RepID=UPI0031DF9A56
MKNIAILSIILLAISCNNGTLKHTPELPSGNSVKETEFMKKLDGEWAVRNDWQDSVLTFSNAKDRNFQQEIFPTYNTIIFNTEDDTIKVETYGEFGDGTSAIQNLKINNSKWSVENGLLKLKFDYSDYSGQHHLESTYSIERTKQQLILKKTK